MVDQLLDQLQHSPLLAGGCRRLIRTQAASNVGCTNLSRNLRWNGALLPYNISASCWTPS